MIETRSSLSPSKSVRDAEKVARESHHWAVEIVANRFREGLDRVFERAFVDGRFTEFARRSDPVYVTLLEGMNDEGVARTMVGNWMVAHTLATQARFWLEDVVVDLLYKKAAREPDPRLRPEIFSLAMLGDGWYASRKSIWNVGERWREQIHGRGGWRPLIQEKALDEIEQIAAEEERQFDALPSERRDLRGAVTPSADDAALARAGAALGGPARPTLVRCNLLFIEPERRDAEAQVWGIRYINPTTFNQSATVKGERVNLLRLRAYLAQEKPFRAPGKIRVIAADLLPRHNREDASGRSAAHFSPRTRWNADKLWEFIGIPFGAVTAGIREAGNKAGERLRTEIRRLGVAHS